MSTIQGYPIAQLPGYEIQGFALTYASTTTITVGLGTCWDSKNVMQIVLGSATVVGAVTAAPYTINAALAGAGGLDTGTFAEASLYYVHVIASSYNNQLPGALISLSATAPLLPSGYDSFRCVGSWATLAGSAAFALGYWSGNGSYRYFQYDAPYSVQTAITGTVNIALNAAMPSVLYGNAVLNVTQIATAAEQTVVADPYGFTTGHFYTQESQAAETLTGQFSMLPGLNSGNAAITATLSAGTSMAFHLAGFYMAL